MNLAPAIHATIAVLRREPSDVLPFYLVAAAVPAVARSVLVLAVTVVVGYLALVGRLAPVHEVLLEAGRPPDPEAAPEAFADWAGTIGPAVAGAITPGVVAVLLAATLAAVVLLVLLTAGASAGRIATCDARLDGRPGVIGGVRGVRRHWATFVGLTVLEWSLWILVSLVGATVGLLGLAIAGLAPLLGVPVVLASLLLWAVGLAVVRGVFAFAPVVAVVDDVGVVASIGGTVAFLRAHPGDALGYYAIAAGSTVALASLAALAGLVGAAAVVGVASMLLLLPGLDLVKTGVYRLGGERPLHPLRPSSADEPTLRAAVAAGIRGAWRETRRFVAATPGHHLAAAAILVAGFATGWRVAGPLEPVVDASIEARLADHVPTTAAAQFLANNWLVAVGIGFGGLVLALPAVVATWTNGLVFGAVARLEVDPIALALFVLPHGPFELPALVVAGALGLHLGVVGMRALAGRTDDATVADALRRAFHVAVGIAMLLLIAAILEGFVSPTVAGFGRFL